MRLMVQSIFATITVASFILILIMAIKNPNPGSRPTVIPRCHIRGCRVICTEAPYFGEYEDEIIFTVSEADSKCSRISLELHNASFANNTLPDSWLSRMRCNVNELVISGGNLMHIRSGAFMSQFTGNVHVLVFQNIHIKTWKSTSFVGLSSLRTLNILNSHFDGAHENALRAVDDTLETLTITGGGNWDPKHVTGYKGLEKLAIVDLSYNNFNEILNKLSFVGLELTKILYLNSCRITAIGTGAFDHLKSIEVLYLNNNMLSTVPSGLFDTIVALENPRPRLNLQNNNWFCDCSVEDLRQLVRKEILLVEAKCTYPDEMNLKTFTQFEQFCSNAIVDNVYEFSIDNTLSNNTNRIEFQNTQPAFYPDPVYVNGSYCSRTKNNSVQLISPIHNNVCSSNNFRRFYLATIVDHSHKHRSHNNTISKWIQFSYILTTNMYSIVQIEAIKEQQEHGLIWYQSTCPHDIYCLDVIPTFLRVYNVDPRARYTFCPINIKNASVENENCVDFSVIEKKPPPNIEKEFDTMLYIMTGLLCSSFGAIVVYGVIRQKPTLLKGSKRVLFVKHKNVDALVLPPKLPFRTDLNDTVGFKDKEIFTLTPDKKLKPPNVKRMKSVRSDKSGSPSYISAMQPTEDQLAEWRVRHHFNNDLTISSAKSELSTLSWVDASYYYSLDDYDRTYESLK